MIEINGTIVVQIINFLILVALLAKFAYKPLLKVMQERQDRIASDLASAEEAKVAAEKLKAEYDAQLFEARKQAQEILDKASKQAEAETQMQLKELRDRLNREKEQARKEIAREREVAMQQLRAEVVTLSLEMASKVIAKDMTTEDNKALVSDAIDKLDTKMIGL